MPGRYPVAVAIVFSTPGGSSCIMWPFKLSIED